MNSRQAQRRASGRRTQPYTQTRHEHRDPKIGKSTNEMHAPFRLPLRVRARLAVILQDPPRHDQDEFAKLNLRVHG
eukprot:4134918-Pleurochrysis_carterae.AAC.2